MNKEMLDLSSLDTENLKMRFAQTDEEIRACQALRYRVFYEEMTAKPTDEMARLRLDFDDLDPHCDHMMVIDQDRGEGTDGVVGTYRLVRRHAAEAHGSFYTQSEFNIDKIIAYDGELLELGRSCVDKEYRTQAILNRLWKGIGLYVKHYDVKFLFGCVSFPIADPKVHADSLSYLYQNSLAPESYRPHALKERYVDMNMKDVSNLKTISIIRGFPPLVKGYMRIGGLFGDGAIVDEQFDTVDVCIVVKPDEITGKYAEHFLGA
ncbi:MAG: GNAT family N-acetyltransferase [Alphaproteobacteria bacterium]